jgi:hypothetical protein
MRLEVNCFPSRFSENLAIRVLAASELEARDATNYPMMHKQAHTKIYQYWV